MQYNNGFNEPPISMKVSVIGLDSTAYLTASTILPLLALSTINRYFDINTEANIKNITSTPYLITFLGLVFLILVT